MKSYNIFTIIRIYEAFILYIVYSMCEIVLYKAKCGIIGYNGLLVRYVTVEF